jgi:hypothetical protein
VLNYPDFIRKERLSREGKEAGRKYSGTIILENLLVGALIAIKSTAMGEYEKIVIVDEAGFSRICLSILLEEGFQVESLVRGEMELSQRFVEGVSLLITSYPYGKTILNRLSDVTVPVIVLVDHVGREIIELLEELENSYCMVKPIDYRRFTLLVKNLVRDTVFHYGGYSIV